ncbi:MAG: tetratricopeptide repeat protein [Desulfuromonadia bacterium]
MNRLLVCTIFTLHLSFPLVVHANDPISLNDHGASLLEKGRGAGLLRLQEAYRSNPYDETIRRNLAIGFVVEGEKSLAAGRLEEAEDRFSRAVELFPDDGDFRLYHAISLHALKRYDHAEVEYDQAVARIGETKGYLFHLGRLRYDTGRLDEAISLWEKGLSLDPSDRELQRLVEKTRKERIAESSMERGGSGRFSISYDLSIPTEIASGLLDLLEEAYNRVGSFLDHYPEARVPVLVYTRRSFQEVVNGPDWSGGVYDGKIRLPLGGVRSITPEVKALLFHEYAHVVVFSLTRGNVPMWLNEGIAEMMARTQFSPPPAHHSDPGPPLSRSLLEGSFSRLPAEDARRAYLQSHLLVTYIAGRFGSHTLGDLLRRLGEGGEIPQTFDTLFSPLGLTYDQLFEEWGKTIASPATFP